MIVGITRVRNEELIIEDTLRHALGRVDRVILYDDASTDRTLEIARDFDGVMAIEGSSWRRDRPAEETRHRAILMRTAKGIGAEWCWCFDADERLDGDLPEPTGNGFRFRLFDGYMADGYDAPYTGGRLDTLPRMWGPEYRDILMMFRIDAATYRGPDRREPIITSDVALADVRVKHYGKCLSVDHWDDTCNYYADHWPEPYRSKWAARRGKAIHTKSDFGRPLYRWGEVANHGVPM